jgi:hypothetical protein
MASNKGWNRASRKDTEPVSNKDGTWPAIEIQNLASSKRCNLASKKDTEPDQQQRLFLASNKGWNLASKKDTQTSQQ